MLQIFCSYSEFLNALTFPLKLQKENKKQQHTLSQTKFYGWPEPHHVLFCVQLSSGQHNYSCSSCTWSNITTILTWVLMPDICVYYCCTHHHSMDTYLHHGMITKSHLLVYNICRLIVRVSVRVCLEWATNMMVMLNLCR